jgi:hypothetical protein
MYVQEWKWPFWALVDDSVPNYVCSPEEYTIPTCFIKEIITVQVQGSIPMCIVIVNYNHTV